MGVHVRQQLVFWWAAPLLWMLSCSEGPDDKAFPPPRRVLTGGAAGEAGAVAPGGEGGTHASSGAGGIQSWHVAGSAGQLEAGTVDSSANGGSAGPAAAGSSDAGSSAGQTQSPGVQACLTFQSWKMDQSACIDGCLNPQCGDVLTATDAACVGANVEQNCDQSCPNDLNCFCACTAGQPSDCSTAYGNGYICSVQKCAGYAACNH